MQWTAKHNADITTLNLFVFKQASAYHYNCYIVFDQACYLVSHERKQWLGWKEQSALPKTRRVLHTYHHVEYHRLAIASWKTCENVVSSGQMTYHVGRGAATTSHLRSRIEDSKQLLLPLLNHLRWIYEDQSSYYRRSFDF